MKIPLQPIFEQIFGTSDMSNPEEVTALIAALREMGDVPLNDEQSIKELAVKVKEKIDSSKVIS